MDDMFSKVKVKKNHFTLTPELLELFSTLKFNKINIIFGNLTIFSSPSLQGGHTIRQHLGLGWLTVVKITHAVYISSVPHISG